MRDRDRYQNHTYTSSRDRRNEEHAAADYAAYLADRAVMDAVLDHYGIGQPLG
jgi:hypothetical protein